MDDQGDLGGWALAENVQAKFFVPLNEIINYFKCLLEFKIELGVPLIRFKKIEKNIYLDSYMFQCSSCPKDRCIIQLFVSDN